jgi:hypothetical protein
VEWIALAQVRDQSRAVMNLTVPHPIMQLVISMLTRYFF